MTDAQEKITTRTYFGCGKCEKKMETVSLGSSTDLFAFTGGSKALYCDNKECERYGFLTIVGIKKTE